MHPYNAGLLAAGVPRFIPATPHGVQQMLIRTGNDPAGKHVVICGRSNIVGKPLAALLLQKRPGANATVTVCHTGTADLPQYTRQADVFGCRHGQPSRNQSGHGQGRLRGYRRGGPIASMTLLARAATDWWETWTSKQCRKSPAPYRPCPAALAP